MSIKHAVALVESQFAIVVVQYFLVLFVGGRVELDLSVAQVVDLLENALFIAY